MNNSYHFEHVVEAINFIEDRLQEPLNVQDVCALSTLSCWQFQRVFRAHVGDSIGNYIRGRRLAMAAQELKTSSESRILDIALNYQFNSHEAFTRAIKDSFGLTPVEVKNLPMERLIYAKPKLSRSKLVLIHQGISKQPEIKKFGTKRFVGLGLNIVSPLGIEAESNGIVTNFWGEFEKRRHEIPGKVKGISYGFASSPDQSMTDESLSYLAAVEVVGDHPVPKGMDTLTVFEEEYAIFEVKGFLNCCNVTTDYIYGIWFPQSKYIRGNGPDFELFDHKIYRKGDETSTSYYYVPVKKL